MPGGVAALRALGVEVTGRELRGIRYVDGTVRAEASFRGHGGLGLRRTTLHSALHQRALSLGVRMLPGKVGEVHQSPDTVTAAGITARWLIAADGLHSPCAAAWGWNCRAAPTAATDCAGTTAPSRGRTSWRSTGPVTARPM